MYKRIDPEILYKSFRQYEVYVESQVRAGLMDKTMARALLNSARKNYSNQSLNREMERLNAHGNTKK